MSSTGAFVVGEYKSAKNWNSTLSHHIKTVDKLTPQDRIKITGGMHLVPVAEDVFDRSWKSRSHWCDGTDLHEYNQDVSEHADDSGDTKILFTSGNAAHITPLNHFDHFECGDNVTHNEAKRISSDSDEFGDCIIVLNKTLFEKMGVQVLIKDHAVIGVFPTTNGTFELPAGYYTGSVRLMLSFRSTASHLTLLFAHRSTACTTTLCRTCPRSMPS